MMRLKMLFAVFALPMATGAAAVPQADSFCPVLRQIVAAAEESSAFASITRGNLFAPPSIIVKPSSVPNCHAEGNRLLCYKDKAPVQQTAADLSALHRDIASCLGIAGAPIANQWEGQREYRAAPKILVKAYMRDASRESGSSLILEVVATR